MMNAFQKPVSGCGFYRPKKDRKVMCSRFFHLLQQNSRHDTLLVRGEPGAPNLRVPAHGDVLNPPSLVTSRSLVVHMGR